MVLQTGTLPFVSEAHMPTGRARQLQRGTITLSFSAENIFWSCNPCEDNKELLISGLKKKNKTKQRNKEINVNTSHFAIKKKR